MASLAALATAHLRNTGLVATEWKGSKGEENGDFFFFLNYSVAYAEPVSMVCELFDAAGCYQLLMDWSSLFVLSKELPPSPDIVHRLLRVLRTESLSM